MNYCPHGDDRIEPGDPRYDGFRVEKLWAALAVDPTDNQEGIIDGPDGTPALATDERRLEDLRLWAQHFATTYGVTVRIVFFGDMREVECIPG